MNKKTISALILTSTLTAGFSLINNEYVFAAQKSTNKTKVKSYEYGPLINGIRVKKMLVENNYSKGAYITPKYIVIHDTDNRDFGANALANRNYFANHLNAKASAHYTVDDSNIIQCLEESWRGWHVGDGKNSIFNNSNTIAIELCVNPDNNFEKTVENGISLTKHLMNKYGIPAENVIRHHDASGKICPKMMMIDKPYLWPYFKSAISGGKSIKSVSSQDIKNINKEGRVVNISTNLKIRKNPSERSSVISYVLNGEKVKVESQEGNWYKVVLDSGIKGYALKDYISTNKSTTSLSDKSTVRGKVSNISTNLRVRAGAGNNYNVISYLLLGERVKIKEEVKGWYRVKFSTDDGEKEGFVKKQYIEKM